MTRSRHAECSKLAIENIVAANFKFHTSGGPGRRPCLGPGRGRRIYNHVVDALPSEMITLLNIDQAVPIGEATLCALQTLVCI